MLVFVRGGEATGTGLGGGAPRTLLWVDREGREEPVAAETLIYNHPRLSPDGQRLAVSIIDQAGLVSNEDIWIHDLARGTSSRLTFGPASDQRPVWTPDGESIVYYSSGAEQGLFRRAANGTGQAEKITTGLLAPAGFSPDGIHLSLP